MSGSDRQQAILENQNSDDDWPLRWRGRASSLLLMGAGFHGFRDELRHLAKGMFLKPQRAISGKVMPVVVERHSFAKCAAVRGAAQAGKPIEIEHAWIVCGDGMHRVADEGYRVGIVDLDQPQAITRRKPYTSSSADRRRTIHIGTAAENDHLSTRCDERLNG